MPWERSLGPRTRGKGPIVQSPRASRLCRLAAPLLQPEFVVLGAHAEHLGAARRAAFILAGHTTSVACAGLALGADALSLGSYPLLIFLLAHHESLRSQRRTDRSAAFDQIAQREKREDVKTGLFLRACRFHPLVSCGVRPSRHLCAARAARRLPPGGVKGPERLPPCRSVAKPVPEKDRRGGQQKCPASQSLAKREFPPTTHSFSDGAALSLCVDGRVWQGLRSAGREGPIMLRNANIVKVWHTLRWSRSGGVRCCAAGSVAESCGEC